MSSYTFIKFYSSIESVSNAEYVDIDFSDAKFDHPPIVTVTINDTVNHFVSNLTKSSARIEFSAKFTGNVYYTLATNPK